MGAGLPPSARLRRAADFAALRKAAGRWQGQHFLFRWNGNAGNAARLGIAVSRKVSKRAVERNRLKRIIRESFRGRRETLPPLDILVIARTSAAGMTGPILYTDLEHAWQKLKALKQARLPGTIGG